MYIFVCIIFLIFTYSYHIIYIYMNYMYIYCIFIWYVIVCIYIYNIYLLIVGNFLILTSQKVTGKGGSGATSRNDLISRTWSLVKYTSPRYVGFFCVWKVNSLKLKNHLFQKGTLNLSRKPETFLVCLGCLRLRFNVPNLKQTFIPKFQSQACDFLPGCGFCWDGMRGLTSTNQPENSS